MTRYDVIVTARGRSYGVTLVEHADALALCRELVGKGYEVDLHAVDAVSPDEARREIADFFGLGAREIPRVQGAL
jgi:hypothetical protein